MAEDAQGTKAPPRRNRRPMILGGVVAVGLVIGALYYLHHLRFEETDDAQVDADISDIGARVSGIVTRVLVVENQPVRAGQLLAELDQTDLQVALAQARAAVAQAAAQLEAEDPTVLITQASNAAALTNASSEIQSAEAAVAGAEKEVAELGAKLVEAEANARNAGREKERGEQLFKDAAIPRADLDRRETAAAAAEAVVAGTHESLAAARARVAQQRAQLASTKGRLTEVRTNAPRQVATRRASVLYRQANLDLARAQ